MTNRRQFKLGIIGCGRISQTYFQAIADCPAISLVAVMDTRQDAASSAAEAAGCRGFTDLEQFIHESGAEGAIICAPPAFHRPIACALIDHGIHVLCEKPFATSYEDAKTMVELANERDVVLMMASKFRYVEDIVRAKAMVTSGMLGDILFYENSFCSKVSMRDRWNADLQLAGGGVVIDNGTHSVDIARYMIGPIHSVHVFEGKRVMGLPVEDTASLSFTTEDGVMGVIHLSWSINVEQESFINILGTEGKLMVGWKESKYQHNNHPEWISFGVGYNKVHTFKNLVMNFVDTVRGIGHPIISTDDALASVQVIEAAYHSMRNQSHDKIPEKEVEPCLVLAAS